MSPLWLLLLLNLHWIRPDPPAVFSNCDAKTTRCFVSSTCAGSTGEGLVQITQAEANGRCSDGFELNFADDNSWTIGMQWKEGGDIGNVALIGKNGDTTVRLADCKGDTAESLYKTTIDTSGTANACTVRVESIIDKDEPLADVFHLSYGESKLCLEIQDENGQIQSACTEPIKFDVFNTDCKDRIGTDCHPAHTICEPAHEEDNVFSCPDKEKNMIFIDDKFVSNSAVLRCTKKGWRSADVSELSTGQFYKKEKAAPQCVSLCDNRFIKSSNLEEKELEIANGVLSCKKVYQELMFDGNSLIGKPVTCSESKLDMPNKVVEPSNGFMEIKCVTYINQFLNNSCSSELKTEPSSCGTFNDFHKHLKCAGNGGVVLLKNIAYDSIFANIERMRWEDPDRSKLDEIEKDDRPYCVFLCSDVFLNLTCHEGQSCSQAKFNGEFIDKSYKSSLECQESESNLIFNGEMYTEGKITCEEGVWKHEGGTVVVKKEGSVERIGAHCHNNCHESLVVNDCNGEHECKIAKMRADNSLYCEDDHYVITARADSLKSRTAMNKLIFLNQSIYKQLQCTKEGWIGDNEKIIDFITHPQNDINVTCRSKCASEFVKFIGDQEPTYSSNILACPDEGILEIRPGQDHLRVKYSMKDLRCDEMSGWQEISTGNSFFEFDKDDFVLQVTCIPSCTNELLAVNCEGREDCVKPVLKDKKLTCDKSGTVLRVNSQLEFDHLQCNRESWTRSNPNDEPILRRTHNETIDVSCLSKCDHTFVKTSPCVAESTCDAFVRSPEAKISCANPKDYIVVNSIPSASPFSCDSINGWANDEGAKAGDFSLNEVEVEAHCFRNCDKSRIEDVCKGDPGCAKFNYENDVLSCPTGFVLNVNEQDVFEDVLCDAGGFKTNSDASFLLKFTTTNVQESLKATCVSKCNDKYMEKRCDVQQCDATNLPLLTGSELKCADENDLLVLGSTPVFSSSLHCDPLSGWKEGDAMVHDFSENSVLIRATCRQLCNEEMIRKIESRHDNEDAKSGFENYVKGTVPLQCADKQSKLVLNGIDSGPVTCDSKGWRKEKEGSYVMKFDAESTGSVTAECRHKCDPGFVQQVCNGGATCSNAIYSEHSLSCAHPSELLVIDDIESPTDLTCKDDGWSDGSNLIIEKTNLSLPFTVRVQCVQLCHPDFVTLKEGASPFVYSLGGKLTCTSHSDMLVTQDTRLYADLVCSKEGWKREGEEEMLIPFHGEKKQRTIVARCEPNDCLSRGFVPPCKGDTNSCVTPNHTAYTMFCDAPYKLIPDMTSMVDISSPILKCRGGKWYDGEMVVSQGDETPMRLQCFAENCVKCGNTLKKGCNPEHTESFCKNRNFTKGFAKNCSAYKCEFWWRIGYGGSFDYSKGEGHDVTCSENGQDYKFGDMTLSSTVDCVEYVPCAFLNPLKTDCVGVNANCWDGFNHNVDAATHKHVDCPAPNKLFHKTGIDGWKEGSQLRCEGGHWTMKMKSGGERDIGKDERVICASGAPIETIETTTKSAPTGTSPDPNKRSGKPSKPSANKVGPVVAASVLFLMGIIGSILFVLWYRKRQAQIKIWKQTNGLQQKNDSIIDEISVDSVKTLKL